MGAIKDYSLDHPNEKFSGTDKPKEDPYKVKPREEVKIPQIEMLEPGWSGRVMKKIVGFN